MRRYRKNWKLKLFRFEKNYKRKTFDIILATTPKYKMKSLATKDHSMIILVLDTKKKMEVQSQKTRIDAMNWLLDIQDILPSSYIQVPQGTWLPYKTSSQPYILTVVHPSSWVMTLRSQPKGLAGSILTMGTSTMCCLFLILQHTYSFSIK